MHVLLCAEDSAAELRWELTQASPEGRVEPADVSLASGVAPPAGALVVSGSWGAAPRLPHLVFARQLLPNALPVRAESVRGWASRLFEAVAGVLPDDQPWLLHIEPQYGAWATQRIGARAWHSARRGWAAEGKVRDRLNQPATEDQPNADAGRHRCKLIREALVEAN
jgi:hypothetical protein